MRPELPRAKCHLWEGEVCQFCTLAPGDWKLTGAVLRIVVVVHAVDIVHVPIEGTPIANDDNDDLDEKAKEGDETREGEAWHLA